MVTTIVFAEIFNTWIYKKSGAKLGSNFTIKDSTKKEHQHDLMCCVKCPDKTCKEACNDKKERRLVKRFDEHRIHMFQHLVDSTHAPVTLDDFTILNSTYKHDKYKKKISQVLFIISLL